MKTLTTLLSLAALLNVSASAMTLEQAASLPGLNFAAFRALPAGAPQRAPGLYAPETFDAPLHVVELAPLLNNMRRTDVSFNANGATVRVFGDKSQNKASWFVGFAVDGGDTQFRKGEKLLSWMFIDRKGFLNLNGRSYKVQVEGQLRNRMQSKLVIEPADNEKKPKNQREAKTVFTVQQLSDGVYRAGKQIRIAGKEYRLLYTQNFNENAQGEFANYTGERSIVLMFLQDGKVKGYHWFESAIPSDRVLVAQPKVADDKDVKTAGSLTLGLRLKAGRLEIHYPVE